MKAAYLYNFGRFVRWPEDAPTRDVSFAICLLGQDLFGPTLDGILAGQSIDGRPLVVRRLSTADDAPACRILFIARSEQETVDSVLGSLNGFPVLTVSDLPEFSRRGGMVEFVLDRNRVRFEVNLAEVQSSGLDVGSELLRVASEVRTEPGERR